MLQQLRNPGQMFALNSLQHVPVLCTLQMSQPQSRFIYKMSSQWPISKVSHFIDVNLLGVRPNGGWGLLSDLIPMQ